MSYSARLQALLANGYFPKELPNVFTTADFGNHSVDILADWRAAQVFKTDKKSARLDKKFKSLSGAYVYRLTGADPEIISTPKRGYERRAISITHPISQLLISHEISENWTSILKWLSKQKYSIDKIDIDGKYNRGLPDVNFIAHRAKKSFIESTSDWLAKTDITRFYPSIYTHSIPWAAYGKERVKANLGVYDGSLADRLDALLRASNRNQTVGIPIGPETSRIVAEVLSSRLDWEFSALTCDLVRSKDVDRLQDDWFVGTESLSAAESVLSIITRIYREYGLEINGSKTSIDRTVAVSDPQWLSELGAFLSHRQGYLSGSRLSEFLSLCLRLQSQYPVEPVVNFAMSVIEGTRFGHDDIEPLESFLLKATAMSPISLAKICRVIVNMDRETRKVSHQRVVDRFTRLAEVAMENGNTYEAIWLIYTIRGMRRPLVSSKIARLAENHPGAALPLILLDMKSNGLFPSRLPTAHWEGLAKADIVQKSWAWLLSYEGARKGWLGDPMGLLTKPFFKAMADRDVVFYDPKKNVETLAKSSRARRDARKHNERQTRYILMQLRGFALQEMMSR